MIAKWSEINIDTTALKLHWNCIEIALKLHWNGTESGSGHRILNVNQSEHEYHHRIEYAYQMTRVLSKSRPNSSDIAQITKKIKNSSVDDDSVLFQFHLLGHLHNQCGLVLWARTHSTINSRILNRSTRKQLVKKWINELMNKCNKKKKSGVDIIWTTRSVWIPPGRYNVYPVSGCSITAIVSLSSEDNNEK